MRSLPVQRREDEEEQDETDAETHVKEILRRFPLRQAELHFVPLQDAKDWLSSDEASAISVAHFDGEDWSLTWGAEGMQPLRPGAILALPTLTAAHASLDKLLDDASGIASWDVLDGVSMQRSLYKRRVVQIESGDHRLESQDGASRLERAEAERRVDSASVWASIGDPLPDSGWKRRLSRSLKVGTTAFRFEYWSPERGGEAGQLLEDHVARAQEDAANIGALLAPKSDFLQSLLVEAAKRHDLGKKNPKWQRAMGNHDMANPVAKPVVDRPGAIRGYRHEWASLLEMHDQLPVLPEDCSETDRELWLDLWRHLVGSHHGNLRPWLSEKVLDAHPVGKQRQSVLRLESAERFARLQRLLGPCRLAYLEALLKAADVAASQTTEEDDSDEQ